MIVGLIGPSCSGKSFLLNILEVWLGFAVPTGLGVEIVMENISELKYYRGVAIKVIPYNLEDGIRKFLILRIFAQVEYPGRYANHENSETLKCFRVIFNGYTQVGRSL